MEKIFKSFTFFLWCWLLCIQLAATDWPNSKRDDEENDLCSVGYRCPSGGCIPLEHRCDKHRWHCMNNEDQLDCDSCSEGAFFCASDRQCIPGEWRCDGDKDCPSGEDEAANCPCDFKCEADGACISSSRVCNGYLSCSDGQDEKGCPCEFKCEASDRCISKDLVCNHYPDCSDGQDEDGCPCPGFICNNKQCIGNSTEVRCDGFTSCFDRSDELNCDSCSNDAFHCPTTQRCIPSSWKCDGDNDCGDDEKDFCNYNYSNTTVEED